MRRLSGVFPSSRRSRRIGAVLALIGALALAIGFGAGLPGSSNGASHSVKSSGSTIVQQRNLVATDTVSGTLSYANPQTVFNRVSGTLTSLPTVGQVVKPGQTLYTVDGAPVILLDGTTPAYRDLSASVSDGTDVHELKQNLVALGFDPSHQITINTTFDAATTAAVERWQASLSETQTGTVTLGQVVFLPGIQRITAVDTVLGSTGGASGAGAGATTPSSSTATGASASPVTPRAEFVSLTTKPVKSASTTAGAVSSAAKITASAACPPPRVRTGSTTTPTHTTTTTVPTATPPACSVASSPQSSGSSPSTLAALIALLKAETLELKKSKTSTSPSAASGAGGRTAGGSLSPTTSAGRSGGGVGGATSSATGTASSGSVASGTTGASTAQALLQTTSTQLVVTVALDATKQSEAVVGQPVTVQLPNGSTVNGKITEVSPVAQTASSASSSSGAGGAASSTPSATVPVTITLSGRRPDVGLDQAAVSVSFEQQSQHNVLSVPVTALLATAGGGYAVQEAAAPHRLIPVTTGLFAAGYVQISGSQVAAGLQVTDSQG